MLKKPPRARILTPWRRALLYPPNMSHIDHHFHLPSLKDYQDEIESITNPVKINDIGLSEDQYRASMGIAPSQSLPRSSRKAAATTSKHQDKDNQSSPESEVDASSLQPEVLMDMVNVEVSVTELNYDELRVRWSQSEEGKRELFELAHHYHLYRDLFSSPSQIPVIDTVPKVRMPKFKPYPDRILHDLFHDWFPGAVRYKDPDPKQIYHFTPHVPIHAEFAVPETKVAAEEETDASKIDPDSLIISPVHRGNLITPLYASTRPNVVIDARISSSACEPISTGLLNEKVTLLTDDKHDKFYTLALLNLDTTLGDEKPVCHWMVTNITGDPKTQQEVMSFMPVYGIRGLGYHRYVFFLMRHEKEISVDPVTDFIFADRKVDPLQLLNNNSAVPIGLSWFQSQWDAYTQKVFHHQLNMKSPVYEYVQPEFKTQPQTKHPFAAPFNVYLDNFRDPKEIAAEVLTERLNKIDPFDYSKEFEVDPLPNAYGEIREISPSWMQATVWKRRNRVNQFRNLRPASAKVPLNNNADLDYPIWPPMHRHSILNKYPEVRKKWKPLKDTKWMKPPNEHPQHEVYHKDQHEFNKTQANEKD
jgi:hypothetical protein